MEGMFIESGSYLKNMKRSKNSLTKDIAAEIFIKNTIS